MKVLLIKDVYKLGRAGDVKKVADGYGRNFLIPQRLAVLATPGALKQVEVIRQGADARRVEMNSQMSTMAEIISGLVLYFPSKAGETGKLYGSITTQMIADAVKKKLGIDIERHNIETQPIRTLGEHKATVRLTIDLTPIVKIVVHKEGESPEMPAAISEDAVSEETAPAVEEKAE